MIKRASALLMTMMFVISACSSSGASSAPSAAASQPAAPSTAASQAPAASSSAAAGAATLTIWADEKRAKAIKPLAASWATANGVNVVVESIASDLTTKFKTASQAGNPPDIVVWAHDVIGDFRY